MNFLRLRINAYKCISMRARAHTHTHTHTHTRLTITSVCTSRHLQSPMPHGSFRYQHLPHRSPAFPPNRSSEEIPCGPASSCAQADTRHPHMCTYFHCTRTPLERERQDLPETHGQQPNHEHKHAHKITGRLSDTIVPSFEVIRSW